MTYKAQRELVEGLRELADFIEENGVKLPWDEPRMELVEWIYDEQPDGKTAKQQMAEAARIFGNAKKVHSSDYFDLRRYFGPIKLEFTTARENVCRKVVKETTIIPAEYVPARIKPERTEEVVEWVCDEPLLAN